MDAKVITACVNDYIGLQIKIPFLCLWVFSLVSFLIASGKALINLDRVKWDILSKTFFSFSSHAVVS